MKVDISIECTPEEARRFLGLPDVAPMQEALLREVEARMRERLAALEPEALWRTWMPQGGEAFEAMRRFWSGAAGAQGGAQGGRGTNSDRG